MMREDTYDNAIAIEGEDQAIQRVSAWLAKHYDSMENEGGQTIELYEYDGEDGDPFEEFEFDLTESVDVHARRVVGAAVEFCDGLEHGKARFKVKLSESRGSVTFTITVPERELDDEVSEGPHAKGFAMQQMRHNERLVKQNTVVMQSGMAMFERVAKLYEGMLEKSTSRIHQLEEGYTSTIKTFEELMSAKHVRDLEMRRLENDERRKDQVAGTLMQMAPHLLGKFLGAPAGAMTSAPQPGTMPGIPNRTPIEMSLEGFLNTFTPEQLEAIMQSGLFQQEQILALVQLATMIKERQEAEEEARKRASSSPEQSSAQGQS